MALANVADAQTIQDSTRALAPDMSVPGHDASQYEAAVKIVNGKPFVLVIGDASNQISLADIEGYRNQVNMAYLKMSEDNAVGNIHPEALLQPGDHIYAFGYTIDKNGVPGEYISVGTSNASVKSLEIEAMEFYTTYVLGEGSSTSSGDLNESNGKLVYSELFFKSEPPYGKVAFPTNLYRQSDYQGHIRYVVVSDDAFCIQTPGVALHQVEGFESSAYKNQKMLAMQNWGYDTNRNNFTYRVIYNYYPNVSYTGTKESTSVTFSTSGVVTYSYTYESTDMKLTDQSSIDYTGAAKWLIEHNNIDIYQNGAIKFKPGSMAGFDIDPAATRPVPICENRLTATFNEWEPVLSGHQVEMGYLWMA